MRKLYIYFTSLRIESSKSSRIIETVNRMYPKRKQDRSENC